MTRHRHWLRGIVGGILFGLGLAMLSVILGFIALGPLTPWVLLVLGILLGVVLVFVPAPWRRGRPPSET